MRKLDRLASMFAVDVGVHHARIQRTGAIQGHQGNEILETVRLHTHDQIAHTARFKLEHGNCSPLLDQFEGFFIVIGLGWQFDQVSTSLTTELVDQRHRPVDHG